MSDSRILSVVATIEYCDGPVLFSAVDTVGELYLCSAFAADENTTHYLCLPISKRRLDSFKAAKIDLRSIYEEPEIPAFYELVATDCEEGELEARLLPEDFPIADKLPESGYYVPPGALVNWGT